MLRSICEVIQFRDWPRTKCIEEEVQQLTTQTNNPTEQQKPPKHLTDKQTLTKNKQTNGQTKNKKTNKETTDKKQKSRSENKTNKPIDEPDKANGYTDDQPNNQTTNKQTKTKTTEL